MMFPRISMLLFGLCVSACGGDDGNDNAQQGQALCQRNCAINKCGGDASAAECEAKCEMQLAKCPAETKAVYECRTGLSADKFACSAEDDMTYVLDTSLCASEGTAARACLLK